MAVLTVIDEEFDAVQGELEATREIGTTGTYTSGNCSTEEYPFILQQCSSRSELPAMDATRELVSNFRPEVLILAGIAGGIQHPRMSGGDVVWSGPQVGDVVLANYIHYAEFTKNLSDGHYMRYYPIDHPCKALLESHGRAAAFHTGTNSKWYDHLPIQRPGPGEPRLHQGELVAAESIAGDPTSERQQEFISRFDNAIAVDMESMGVARAIHACREIVHYNPTWMVVRGISDPVRSAVELNSISNSATTIAEPSNDDTRKVWKSYAAATAARYTAILIDRMLAKPRHPIPKDPGAPAFRIRGRRVEGDWAV